MADRKIKAEHVLSNGQKLQVMSFTGRDMINANRLAPKGDTLAMAFALIASRITIDGKPTNYDELIDMDGDLIQEIMVLVEGDPDKKENFS